MKLSTNIVYYAFFEQCAWNKSTQGWPCLSVNSRSAGRI